MAGVFVYSPDQIRSRYQEEIDKFNIDLKTGIYDKDLVALTFQEAYLGVFGSIAVIYNKETNEVVVTHNGKEVRGSDALNLLNNLIRSSKPIEQSATESEAGSQSSAESEISAEIKSEAELHAGMNLGGSNLGGLGNAMNIFTPSEDDAQVQSATAATQAEQAAARGQTVEVGSSSASSELSAELLEQADHFVDSIRTLCEEFAPEPVSDIEYIENLESEAPPQDTSSAVARELESGTATSDANSDSEMTVSQVGEKVEEKSGTETSTESDLPASESEIKRPIPAQIRKITLGEASFGVSGDSMSIAIFGTMHVIKKLAGYKTDSQGVVLLESPVFEEITVEEMMLGLNEGLYVAEHYEDSNLGISPGISGQPTEPIFFKIQNARALKEQEEEVKVESRKSDIEEINKKAEQEAAKAAQNAKEAADAAAAKDKENEEAQRARVEEERKKQQDNRTVIPANIRRYLNEIISKGLPNDEQERVAKQVERMISMGLSVERIVEFVEKYIKGLDARQAAAAEKQKGKQKDKGNNKDSNGKKSGNGGGKGNGGGGGGKGGGGY